MKFFKHLMAVGVMAVSLSAVPAFAAVESGKAAPDFEALAANGESFKLSDHLGDVIVLEWTNEGCPFVQKHYKSGNMQAVQAKAKELTGAKWVTVISSAPGKQGYVSGDEAQKIAKDAGSDPDAIVLDEDGTVGKLYGAQATPHMYVIDAEGTLVYQGAIDSDSSADPASIAGAENYVLSALEAVKAGEEVKISQTQAYGCPVKY